MAEMISKINIKHCIIVRYAEIGTKGKNRCNFEKQLVNNLHFFLKKNQIKYHSITYPRGRIYINFNDFLIKENNLNFIKNIFGISSYSLALQVHYTTENIKNIIAEYFNEEIVKSATFRISTQKLDTLALSSIEIDKDIGEFVYEKYNKKVSLNHPELDIGIELYQKNAYLFTKKIQAFSGLPVCSEGTILVILKNKRSILAALLLLKRGCKVVLAGKSDIYLEYKQLLDNYISYDYEFYSLTEKEIQTKCNDLLIKYNALAFTKGAYFLNEKEDSELNPIALLDDEEVNIQLNKFKSVYLT